MKGFPPDASRNGTRSSTRGRMSRRLVGNARIRGSCAGCAWRSCNRLARADGKVPMG